MIPRRSSSFRYCSMSPAESSSSSWWPDSSTRYATLMLASAFLRQPTCTAQGATLQVFGGLSVRMVMQIFHRALPAMTSRFAATLRISAVSGKVLWKMTGNVSQSGFRLTSVDRRFDSGAACVDNLQAVPGFYRDSRSSPHTLDRKRQFETCQRHLSTHGPC